MKFGHPDAIFWFFLVFLLFALAAAASWWRKRAWQRFADPALREKILPNDSPARRRIKGLLLFLVLIFLVLTLMEPQWGMREEEVRMKGVDLAVLVDVSNSMLVQDVKPSRLERAKRKLIDLFDMLAGDRVGLVAFAGRSFLLSPLTVDYGTLKFYLDEINVDTIPVQGTDIAGALSLALKALSDPQSTKAILLITDGEDHSERMQRVRDILKEKKIPVYVLGVGTPEGGPVPKKDGGFKSNPGGEMVVSKLQEGFLKDLALSTGGAYVRAVTGDEDLRELYIKGVRGDLEGGDFKVTKKKVWESRFYWPLAVATALLLLERLIPEAKGRMPVVKV
jgi:Ca-activated chloride channel family protein